MTAKNTVIHQEDKSQIDTDRHKIMDEGVEIETRIETTVDEMIEIAVNQGTLIGENQDETLRTGYMEKTMDDQTNVILEEIEITRERVGILNRRTVVDSRGTALVIETILEEQITIEMNDTHRTPTPTLRLRVLPADLEVTRALLGRMVRVTHRHVMTILLVDR